MAPFDARVNTPGAINPEKWVIMDGLHSGALLQLGDIQVGAFVNETLKWARGTAGAGRSLAYFAGGSAGGGRLSYGMAQMLKEWVVAALTTPEGRENNVADGYLGPPRSAFYQDWVDQVAGDLPEHARDLSGHLTGRRAAAFGIIKQTGGGLSLGIRSNVDSRKSPQVGTVPLTYRNSMMNVASYSNMVEFGSPGKILADGRDVGAIPARPIITGAVLKWLQEVVPEWAPAFQVAMERIMEQVAAEESKHTQGMTGLRTGEKIETVSLQDSAYDEDGGRTYAEELSAELSEYEETIASNRHILDMVARGFKTGEVELTPEVRKEVVSAVWNMAEKVGLYDEGKIVRIVTAVIEGREEDIDF